MIIQVSRSIIQLPPLSTLKNLEMVQSSNPAQRPCFFVFVYLEPWEKRPVFDTILQSP